MEILYCEKWWISEKKPLGLIDENNALLRHSKCQPYVAALIDNGNPKYIIDFAGKWVTVAFLDQLIRPYLQYDFKEMKAGKLFLKTATYWEYENEGNSETEIKIFAFDESGRILIEDYNKLTSEVRKLETHESVEENWEEYPAFGQYMSLCREERF